MSGAHRFAVACLMVGIGGCSLADDVARQGDDLGMLLKRTAGAQTAVDDVVAAAKAAYPDGTLPAAASVTDDSARVSHAINNEFPQFTAELACEAYEQGTRETPIDEVNVLLDEIWNLVDTEPGVSTVVDFSCFVLEFKGASEEF